MSSPNTIRIIKNVKCDSFLSNKISGNISESPIIKNICFRNQYKNKMISNIIKKIDKIKSYEPIKTLIYCGKDPYSINKLNIKDISPKGLLSCLENYSANIPTVNRKLNNLDETESNIQVNNQLIKSKIFHLPKLRLNHKKVYIQNALVNNQVFKDETKVNIVNNFSEKFKKDSEKMIDRVFKFKESQKEESKSSSQVKNVITHKNKKINWKSNENQITYDNYSGKKGSNTIIFNRSIAEADEKQENKGYETKNVKNLSITSKNFSKRKLKKRKIKLLHNVSSQINMLQVNKVYIENVA